MGLQPPKIVIEATNDYFADQNAIEIWLNEQCDRIPTAQLGARALFQDWRRFAEARGDDARTEKWFSGELEKEFVKSRTNTGVVFKGIAFKPDPKAARHENGSYDGAV